MAVVGAAEVPVRPTFPGFQREVGKQVSGVGAAFEGSQGRTLGQRLMSGIGTGLKVGALAVGTATAGILTTALVKGWQRLSAIEDAEAKLRGLGHSAQAVESIMDNALNSVLGTAFGMDEAATVAASAVAAGIQPGQELEDVLRLTADAATIAGTGMDEMGSIFNKVASSNKVQGDVIAQLHERGIPVIQMLAKEMGTSVEETYRLASAGEINFETFRAAMEDGVGGAAQNAGETTSGAFANMMAALSRFGAQLLTGVYPLAKHVFGGITEFLDDLTLVAEPVVTSFSEKLTAGLQTFAAAWNGTSSDVKGSGFLSFMQGFGETARSIFDSIVGWIGRFRDGWQESADQVQGSGISGFFERFSLAAGGAGDAAGIAGSVLDSLGQIFTTLLEVTPGLISGGLDLVANILGFLADNAHLVMPLVGALAAGFLTWKVASAGLSMAMMRVQAAQVAMTPVMTMNNLLRLAAIRAEQRHAIATGQATAADYRRTTALTAKSRAMGVATAAQRGLNGAMRANPIGAIVTVITLLVGALIWFFTQTEIGGEIWQNVWSAITTAASWAYENILQPIFAGMQAAFSAVVVWFQTTALPILQSVWQGIATTALWLWESVLQPTWNFIKAAFSALVTYISWYWNTILKPVFDAFAAVATWLWSAVLQPVITLIGDIFKWLWSSVVQPVVSWIIGLIQSWAERTMAVWQNYIQPVFQLIGAIITWVWQNVAKPYFTAIWQNFKTMATWLWNTWQDTIWPALRNFGNRIVALWNSYVSPALQWIGDAWDGLSTTLSRIWREYIRPVFQSVGDFVKNDVVGMIEDGVDMIGDAWRSVANFFRRPINWVINTVWNDGIKAAFDSVAEAVNSDTRLGRIPTIPAFAKGGHHKGGWALVGEEGPELVNFDRPGRVYTADQTRAALTGMPTDAPMTPEEMEAAAGTTPLSQLPIGGWLSDTLRWVNDNTPVGHVVDWTRGMLADGAETLLKPILDQVSSFVSQFGKMGELGGGLIDWGVEKVLDWIRGHDEVPAGDDWDGEFTANPGGFNRPANGPITSWAGPRVLAHGFSNYHHGVDIGAPMGAAVRAAFDGVVKSAGWGPGNLGNTIVLNHGGYDTAYAHLSGMSVSPGTNVTGGQRIGSVGASGGPFAPHLHFERHVPGFYSPVDPNGLFLRDQGGLLYPGLNQVLNKTGRPEYTFNERDFKEVRDIVRGGGAGGGRHLTVNQYGMDYAHADKNVQAVKFAERREARRPQKAGAR